MKKMIAFALVALLALPALAFGQTMQVTGGVTGSGTDSQVLDLVGPQFDLIVRLELVRVGYGDFGGALAPGSDLVVSLRGFQPGDSQPSSFNGELGFVDCSDVKFPVPMGGTDGGVTGSGVEFPDGGMVIQGTPLVVPTDAGTMGQLKARF